jgi:hypothetical protein
MRRLMRRLLTLTRRLLRLNLQTLRQLTKLIPMLMLCWLDTWRLRLRGLVPGRRTRHRAEDPCRRLAGVVSFSF